MGACALNFTKNDNRNLSHLVLSDLAPPALGDFDLGWFWFVLRRGQGITCTVSRGQGSWGSPSVCRTAPHNNKSTVLL